MADQLLSDRYRILQTLGAGGFGETFLAEDTHMPSRRRCVVKKLRPMQNNPALDKIVRERFQREAALLEDLSGSSRQIPALYAYFYSEIDQQYYIVQEWIDGDTLSALVSKQGILNESQVRHILTDILPVFSYIHSRSIVHRDIKPDNIILRHSDQLPVLIDFGAVREAMGTVMNSQGQPTQSIVIGTPGYMPSEQSIGRPVYGSDLYSLGLTAIYLLTGKQPSDLPTDPNSAEILWRNQAPQVSSAFAQILDKAISYHHRDRYTTAAEFLMALSGSPPASPVSTPTNSNVSTYVVAPDHGSTVPTQSSPANANSGKNQLVVGGVIGATIIGGALGAAFLFGNSGSKVTSTASLPPINSPVSTATSSSTPVTLIDTPTPEAPSPSIVPSKKPSVSPPPSSSSPPPTIAPTPSNSATPTATSTPSVPSNQPDPTTTVSDYYRDLNSRDYNSAWNKLPVELRDNTNVHPAGYKSFEDWWNSVAAIEIRNIRVVRRDGQKAEAIARTIYRMKDGRMAPYALRYFLEWDANNQNWAITKIRNK